MENLKSTIVIYTYRYMWKDTKGKLYIRYLTDCNEMHAKFQQEIVDNPEIVSCMREYINEINFEFLGFTEPVKVEKKEEEKDGENNEEICEEC